MNVVVLRRRLFYICAMVILLVPLYFLGHPSVRNTDGSVKQPGGTLAQIRTEYDLGQGDLGEIDPASESMRLATLGLRGVAATILWQKAEYYKKEQYWDRLSATLNQIAILQPHFVKVWEFQSHNLSYNVSAEFDDYRQRYQWVKRGIEYLVQGSKFNKRRTELPYELGWFFGNKMGVADERIQFRELYRDDSNFHREIYDRTSLDVMDREGLGPDLKPDNWLSGRLWYQRAYDMVASGSAPARSVLMFYRMGPQWLMKYAEAIQDEGTLDEAARYAWRRAGRDWRRFGERQIVTTFGDTIYLAELERANAEYTRLLQEFEEFAGPVYDRLYKQRLAQLSEEELAAREKEELERTFDEMMLARQVDYKITVDPYEVAELVSDEKRVDALQMAKQLAAAKDKISHIEIYRNQINYGYWEARTTAEQEDASILARTSMYEANQLLDRGELDAALEKYEVAWGAWASLFNKFPAMMIDDVADDVLASIERYRRLLDQPDLPGDFALRDFVEFRDIYEEDLADAALMNVIASWPKNYPERNFLNEMLRKSVYESGSELSTEEPTATIDVTAPDQGAKPPSPATPPPAEDDLDGDVPSTADDQPADEQTTGDSGEPETSVVGESAGISPTPPEDAEAPRPQP